MFVKERAMVLIQRYFTAVTVAAGNYRVAIN